MFVPGRKLCYTVFEAPGARRARGEGYIVKKGYLYIIVTIVMFTSYEVVLRYIAGQINSMQLTLCRFSVGFLILLPLALRTLRRWGKRLDGRSMARFALLGLLGIALSMPILHLSVRYAGSSVAVSYTHLTLPTKA